MISTHVHSRAALIGLVAHHKQPAFLSNSPRQSPRDASSVQVIALTGNKERRGFMNTMRVAQIPAAKREFEIVERPIPEPPPGTVRIKVTACGVCH